MRQTIRRLTIWSVVGVTMGLISHGLVLAAQDQKPAERDPARWDKDIAAFEHWDARNTPPRDGVLFAGSSSIRMWPTATAFPKLTVINRGFGGCFISEVNHFFDRVALPYKPRVIVFYCGDNDIASGKTPERVADDFRTFAQLVHEKLPGTHVIYLPIKPSVSRWAFWPKMNEANELIRKFIAGDQLLTYVDTATPMLGTDEQPRADLLLDDGLHLNDKGYAIWNELVEPAIAKALATGKTTTTGND